MVDREPLTVMPKPKLSASVNITIDELATAVGEYLRKKLGIRFSDYELEQNRDAQTTTVGFSEVVLPDGSRPIHGWLQFDIDGICARSRNARHGGDIRTVTVQKKKYSDDVYGRVIDDWLTANRGLPPLKQQASPSYYETFADLVAEPNADRSITFFVVDRWEGNTAHWRRPTG